ncbi:hypothetical protein ACVV62_01715 [Streptococcus pluranimalium]
MALSIARRLKRLREIIKRQKEVSAKKAMILWIEFIRRQLADNERGDLNIPDYFTPPFSDVSFDDYERARKELEEYDRQTEQTTRDLFG